MFNRKTHNDEMSVMQQGLFIINNMFVSLTDTEVIMTSKVCLKLELQT